MAQRSLVNEILKLEEIPLSDDGGDPTPPEVARQIIRSSPDEGVLDEAACLAIEIIEEQQRHKARIMALYELIIKNGRRRSVTLNTSSRQCQKILYQLQTEYAAEREYAEKFCPKARSECERSERPCPWVSCRFHLALDGTGKEGSVKLNFPNLKRGDELPEIDFDSMVETCALDVADRTAVTLEEIGVFMNITRERVRQCQEVALAKLEKQGVLNKLLNPQGIANPTGRCEKYGGNGDGAIDFSIDDDFGGLKL